MQRLTALQASLVLLLSVCNCTVFAHRSLLQDAISNSNGCLNDIPKCEPFACVTRNIKGVARWACQRCQGGYSAVVDGSGQDNIIQCVCPRGTYELATPSAADPALITCTRCPQGSFCPGGDRTEAPITRGAPRTCGNGLVTRNTGARSQSDCVAPRGFAMTAPDRAEACERSTYAPHFNRLAKCLRCQSGLQEPVNSGLLEGGRDSKRTVCKVPPGRFMSQGLVRICPQGFYRADYKTFDDSTAQVCTACSPGITTANAGAGLPYLCNQIIPGYGINNATYVNGVITAPALPELGNASTTGYPAATLCGLGFYSSGGNCLQCPQGAATTRLGAQSVEECVVPPGYYLPASAAENMAKCPGGTFREGWLLAADTRAGTCTQCGQGISSEARELDSNPLLPNGTASSVRATSASCYIEPGQGIIADGRNAFVGRDCPKDTYGASGRVYGLMSAPCKPCPRNMITDNAVNVNNSEVCTNPDGFGYASEGASRCAPGFYSVKGSRKPCQQCPFRRSTLDLPSAQRIIEHCLVRPGFGVVSSIRNSTDAFNVDISALNASQQAVLPVLECPVGSYGEGGTAGAKCLLCPAGSSTEEPGAVSSSNCTVCMPGHGRLTSTAPCTLCQQGFYQPGSMATCTQCPPSNFYPPVDNTGEVWTSTGITTFLGATGQDSCVPKETQLSPEAGQAYFSSTSAAVQALVTETNANSLSACIGTCEATACCLVQYNTDTRTCKRASLTPVAADAGGWKLLYKLPPSTLGSASSVQTDVSSVVVRAKMMSSGIYARVAIPDARQSNWLAVGTNLDPTARTFSTAAQTSLWRSGSENQCKTLCDSSNVCWGFVYDGAACLFRGGEDALKTRSFFVLPSGDLGAFNWQGAAPLDFAVGQTLSLAAAQGLTVTGAQVLEVLNAVFAATGSYDTNQALLRIAAVTEVLRLASQQSPPVPVTFSEALQVLQTRQGSGPYNAGAALQAVIDSRSSPPTDPPTDPPTETLESAVQQVQEAARSRSLLVPTWSQAVATLGFMSPDAPRSYNKDGALELFGKAVDKSVAVLQTASLVSRQQAIDALLLVYATDNDLIVDEAAEMLSEDGKVVNDAMQSALQQDVLVTHQHVWDTVKSMRANKQDVKTADPVVEQLLRVNDAVTNLKVSASMEKDTAAAVSWEQRLTIFTMALADSSDDFEGATKLAEKWIQETIDLSRSLLIDQRASNAGVSLAQVVDLVVLARAHQRVDWSKFAEVYLGVLLPDAAEQLVKDFEQAADGKTPITQAEAFGVLVDASSQFGTAANAEGTKELLSAALQQLQNRQQVQEKATEVLTKEEPYSSNQYNPKEVSTAIIELYRRAGYWQFDAPSVAAYIDLARKQPTGE